MALNPRKSVEYDPDTGAYSATYEYPFDPPSIAIPLALMEVTDNDVDDLDPLYDATSVDPDALDELFRPSEHQPRPDCRVTFTYHEYTVTVTRHGRIVIRPLTVQPNHPPDKFTRRSNEGDSEGDVERPADPATTPVTVRLAPSARRGNATLRTLGDLDARVLFLSPGDAFAFRNQMNQHTETSRYYLQADPADEDTFMLQTKTGESASDETPSY